MLELLESWRPWHRRLWDVGTVLALREAVEAADWVGRHVLSHASLAWYARESLLPRLRTDSALGDGQIRRHLPLVGAALDRLAHGHAVSGIAPLDLAGRAELALRVVDDVDGWGPHELLDV